MTRDAENPSRWDARVAELTGAFPNSQMRFRVGRVIRSSVGRTWVTARAGVYTFARVVMSLGLVFVSATSASAQAAAPTQSQTQPQAQADVAQGAVAAPAPPAEEPSRPLDEAVAFDAGATCLDRSRLVRRVARWLQSDRVDANLKVEIHGDPHDPRKVVFIIDRGHDERGVRSIDDGPADCDQLHAALALSIALAIDANLGMGGELPPDLPDDEALLAGKPQPRYFKLGAALMLHATSGLLTSISAGASVRIEAGFMPWLDLRLGAFGSTVDGQRIPQVTPGAFSAGLVVGRADVCLAHALAKLRLLACAGGMGGVFRADGTGFSFSSSVDNRAYGAAVGGFELQAELARWLAIGAAVDLVVPFATRHIQVVDAQMRTSAERTLTSVAVLVGAGPVLRFL